MLKRQKGVVIDIFEKDQTIPRKELLRRVKGVDVILSILTDKVDAAVMDAAGPPLKMIANYGVGFDNVDLSEAKVRKIVVSNAPSLEMTEAVAEHAVAMIFALAHRLVEADTFARAGKYHGWGPKILLGTDVIGKTLGLIGGGRIGTALARRLHAGFGVKIVYNDLKRNPDLEKLGAKYLSKNDLLKNADIISLHVPLLPSTRHLISTKELKMMKKTAFLINTARGPIVDQTALIKALQTGQIAGAGLDVFECEPLIACNPKQTKELRALKNVVITPHTASATWSARQAMSRVTAENILAFLSGKTPPNVVKYG